MNDDQHTFWLINFWLSFKIAKSEQSQKKKRERDKDLAQKRVV